MTKLLLLAFALGFTACSDAASETPTPEPEPSDITELRSEKQRVTSPNVPAQDLQALIEGNTAFALDLLKQVSPETSGNIVYSPHSISLALAMTHAGARGTTEAAIASTMHFQLDQVDLHPAFNQLDLLLASRGQNAQASDGTPFKLNIANALWLQQDADFEADFIDVLGLNYGAGVNLLDYKTDPEAARKTINDWVEDKTEDKIQDLLPAGVIKNDTAAVLTNAIYFNAAWRDQFPSQSQDAPFALADGTEISVPTMAQMAGYNHVERPDFHALELPYDQDEVSMVILMPTMGSVQDLEMNLTAAELEATFAALEPKIVQLALPKFKFETPLPLAQHLKTLGMDVAFSSAADFSGISSTLQLAITDVLHKAMIDVNEKGTEAAAATAVIIGPTSAPSSDLDLNIDRPFLFLIRDMETNAILFIGRVADPR
jgi:serpin B